ncbi:MAG TPA: radical SAM family heme chaperone HemW [Gemmatimonadales bacterium]|nr:radical SAM family heme chaperone HemW [Gemmatimonadales bacterium]
MRHVYVHVPFCRRRCSYCDFAIAVRRATPADAFVSAVRAEHRLRRHAGEWDADPLETLYLGGGTPSLLPADAVTAIVAEFLGAEPPLEVSLEANPEDVTPEAARSWRAAGVTRVSLGVQSFQPAVLEWMHRSHGVSAAAGAVRTLRAAGFESVSLDLIFGLPAEVRSNFTADLDAALGLEPDHLSVYGLTAEPRTPYARWLERDAVHAISDEAYAEQFLLAHERLTAAGFEHYEVSNYARPGHRSRHNSAYWTGAPYAGLGPSAHRYRLGERSWNVGAWVEYERRLRHDADPTAEREILTPDQRLLERIYLGLRTVNGIEESVLRHLGVGAFCREAKSSGLLVQSNGRLQATPQGWLKLDEIVTVLTTSVKSG